MLGSVIAPEPAQPASVGASASGVSALGQKAPRAFRDLLVARFREDQEVLPATPAIRGKPETYFRASALGKVCGRMVALQIAHRKKIRGDLDPQTLHMFAKGHAYHWMHQERVLPVIATNGLLGWWTGPDGVLAGNHDDGRPVLWSIAQAIDIMGCAPHALQYREPACYDHQYMLRGHPDAIVDWSALDFSHPDAPSEPEIFEFKTRHDSDWMWNTVDPEMGGKPLDAHVLQVQAYMMLTGIKHARIIYMKKGDDELQEGLHASYAEWRVGSDPEFHARIRKYLLTWHETVLVAHLSEQAPPNTRCAEFSKGAAAKCALRYLCFNKAPKKVQDNLVDMTPAERAALDSRFQEFLDTLTPGAS